jgi:hypothetical protein
MRVRAAAELDRRARPHDAHEVAVLLAGHRDRARRGASAIGSSRRDRVMVVANHRVDALHHVALLLGVSAPPGCGSRSACGRCRPTSRPARPRRRARRLQRALQQMRRSCDGAGSPRASPDRPRMHRIADASAPRARRRDARSLRPRTACRHVERRRAPPAPISSIAAIADLAALFRVERRAVEDELRVRARSSALDRAPSTRIATIVPSLEPVVAREFAAHRRQLADVTVARFSARRRARARAALHLLFEARESTRRRASPAISRVSSDRKAVRVVQREDVFAREQRRAVAIASRSAVEHLAAAIERAHERESPRCAARSDVARGARATPDSPSSSDHDGERELRS